MPPRKRPTFARRHTVNIDVHIAGLSLDAWERYWGGEAEGRAAGAALGAGWETGRSPLRTNVSTWPGRFWAYTPDVPSALRPLANLYSRDEPALWVRAFRWFLGDGRAHLRPNEETAIRERLADLERE